MGNIYRSKVEVEKMVEDNLRLVWHTMNRHNIDPTDDNFQVGCIGLMKACRTYDKNSGIKFSSYAVPCIMNEIKMEIRSKNSKSNKMYNSSLRFGYSSNDNDCVNLEDVIPEKESELDKVVVSEVIRRAVERISARRKTKQAVLELLLTEIVEGEGYCGVTRYICNKHNIGITCLLKNKKVALNEIRKFFIK